MIRIARGSSRAALTFATLGVALALTGCSRLGSLGDTAQTSASTPAPVSSANVGAASSPAPGPGSLDSITQDLNSADDASTQADSNVQSADQATAAGDEP